MIKVPITVHPISRTTSVSKHRLGQAISKLDKPYQVSNLNYEGWDFTIPAGFEWNGANTFILGTRLEIPALIHDYIYSGLGDEKVICLTRKDADDIFLFYMKECKIPKWVRYPAYLAVRMFGWRFWQGRFGNNRYESPTMPKNGKRYNLDCQICNGTGWYGITEGFGGDGYKKCFNCNKDKNNG